MADNSERPDDTGFTAAPAPYMVGDREVIDQLRDDMSDSEFGIFCRAMAKRYAIRVKNPKVDLEKSRFYQEMADHVFTGSPDPRHRRGDAFQPYKRASMPEPLPERRINVLDHGFVRFIEDWGGGVARLPEAGIIEAARQSTQGSFRGWRRDASLLRYLHEHKHSTPFEFAGMTLEICAPIFVFREWHRHRSQSYSEMSARYAPLPDFNYVPTWEEVYRRSHEVDQANKQAGRHGEAPAISEEGAKRFVRNLEGSYAEFDVDYKAALAAGVPKELARLGMPVGRYSQMRATANLRNWLAFLTLRMDPAAQWEIRQYAQAVYELVLERFPQTAALFKPV